METDTTDQYTLYISSSIQNINKLISRNDYRKAFGLLILFLERLEEQDKKDVIQYYSIHLREMCIL
jgi:hypothetical protein